MKIGRVIDNIWATRKEETLRSAKLMIVQILDTPADLRNPANNGGKVLIAADIIGAGIGEMVIVVGGSSARRAGGYDSNVPIDAMIVGIIDENEWGVDKE
ncbi:MAG TPA: EutN/CcmL family microcompartment protein [Firmicutes bacterium]|nr:EutN/CcmL family microcompartment protein [Bacillota bacterium]